MKNIFSNSLMPLKCHIIKLRGGPKNYVDFQNRGTKKLNLEIGGPKVQQIQNRGTKSTFKPISFSHFEDQLQGKNQKK
jgi:hypothetical protein